MQGARRWLEKGNQGKGRLEATRQRGSKAMQPPDPPERGERQWGNEAARRQETAERRGGIDQGFKSSSVQGHERGSTEFEI